MKKLTVILVLIAASVTINAQKVALHSVSGIQHFTGTDALVEAYAASVSGDTIYIPGGGFNAPSNIDKPLLIYGAGHYPDSTAATAKTYIIGSIYLSENADGLRLEGVEVNGGIYFDTNEQVDNVIIKYCKITGDMNVQGNLDTPSSNMTVINCIFQGAYFYLSNIENAAVQNCIIHGRVLNTYGNLFENNIFMFSYTGTSSSYTINGNNNICRNNIFLNESSRYFSGISNQIYNNIFVVAPVYGITPIESGNISPVNLNSIFVNETGHAFDYSHDYHLQSPSSYTGTDGTQIGLYGGTYAYKEGAVPSNPHIQSVIIDPVTDNNGLLNIQIKAAAQVR